MFIPLQCQDTVTFSNSYLNFDMCTMSCTHTWQHRCQWSPHFTLLQALQFMCMYYIFKNMKKVRQNRETVWTAEKCSCLTPDCILHMLIYSPAPLYTPCTLCLLLLYLEREALQWECWLCLYTSQNQELNYKLMQLVTMVSRYENWF